MPLCCSSGLGAVLTPHAHGGLLLTLVLLATDLVIAGALVTGWYPVRPVAQGLTIFGALVHVLVLLRSGPVLLRGCSGLLVAAHGYALVLLFQLSVSEQDEENDEGDTKCVAAIEPAAGSADFEESPDIEPDTPDLPDAEAAGDTSRSPAAPQVSTEQQPARPDPPDPAALVGAVEPAEDVDTIKAEEPAEPPEPTGSDSQGCRSAGPPDPLYPWSVQIGPWRARRTTDELGPDDRGPAEAQPGRAVLCGGPAAG